jgi:hypothetical protein
MNNMLTPVYKIDKKGNTRIWQVIVNGDSYTVSTGIDGMGMTNSVTKCKGKSIGKKNETTPEQQALKEATAKRTKKIDREGYTENLDTYEQPFSVQLCSNYVKTPAKCIKNATPLMWSQNKLDGLKGYFKSGKMHSRKDTVYEKVHQSLINKCKVFSDHLIKERGMKHPVIDGELFINNKFWLEDLNSIVKGGETLSGFDKAGNMFDYIGPEHVNLHICNVYDDTVKDLNYEDIIPFVAEAKQFGLHYCQSFPFEFAHTEQDLSKAIDDGDEGIVIYMNRPYKKGKHDGVWKVKNMKDAEWPIVGFKETKTITEKDGTIITQFQHVCATDEGVEFAVRMEGTNKHRETIGTGQYIGKLLKIRYQGLYKSTRPQFPVGVAVRLRDDL